MSDLYRIDETAITGPDAGELGLDLRVLINEGVLVKVEPCEHDCYDPHIHTTDGETRSLTILPEDHIAFCPGADLGGDT